MSETTKPKPLSERLNDHAESAGDLLRGSKPLVTPELRADLWAAAHTLREINVVCGLAGVGERDQTTLDRVRSLAAELGAALGREEALQEEITRLRAGVMAPPYERPGFYVEPDESE